jgi:hypothetical protein
VTEQPGASFRTHAEAEQAVDRLSDKNFPVERVAIVARDLKLVEQVTGRRGYLAALAIDGLWFGAVVGALWGLLLHAVSHGRRDFDSVAGLSADHYEVLVDDEVAAKAASLLADPRVPGQAGPSAEGPKARAARSPRAIRARAGR